MRADSGPYSIPVCGKLRRVRDERGRGRREWASENGMRWDSWDALASKKRVRMEGSGRVDNRKSRFDGGRQSHLKIMYVERFGLRRRRRRRRPRRRRRMGGTCN